MKRKNLLSWAAAAALTATAGLAQAQDVEQRSLCVFDPVGANGDMYQLMKDYALAGRELGVDFRMRPYTEESTARADFQAGKCDAVALTGIQNRNIVRFAGSLDMMAATPSYEAERTAIAAISGPNAAELMQEGPYEVVGVIPLGMAYLFGRSRDNLDDWKKLAGQKVAVISNDEQAVEMVQYAGGTVVAATTSTFAGMFNNGSVDLAYAPAFAYEALEMYKGLGENGGILRYNLGQLSGQINIHRDRFPEGFGVKSREWVFNNMWDDAMRIIEQAEAAIPKEYWVDLDEEKAASYNEMFAEVRQSLFEKEVYHPRMQLMLKKIRCREIPGNADCTQDTEGGPAL